MNNTIPPLAEQIAAALRVLPQVEAVVLAGSTATRYADPRSDIDIDVYTHAPIPPETRAAILRDILGGEAVLEINNQYWETGDEGHNPRTGQSIDILYRSPDWIEGELRRVLERHEASVGYTTCLWHNVQTAVPLFDRGGWFASIQALARQPYPEPLRRAITSKNHPILNRALSSYRHQIELAIQRGDRISVNHRAAALLASYFDILWAVNRVPNPGEKRMLAIAQRDLKILPDHLEQDINTLLDSLPGMNSAILAAIDMLVNHLDRVLIAEGLLS